ncbi:hypothetical protein [Paenibacillus graminis]|uniref:hypothetical protein n=1 Tax=Paenibacillus graminis TaxID=189425 RepID=UPI002DBB3BD1|nr:hypothetical protein [Paenibacillus graminis]MEC0167855.1 hypothetical protein [Paenibacillus graminis]
MTTGGAGGAASVGEIRARITLEMTEFRRQLEEARRRIRELEGDTRRGADGFRDMGGAIAGLAAGAGLSKLVNEMQRAVDAATKLHSAFAGLNAVAKGFGVQTKDAQAAVEALASRGFLSLTEAAQAYKTALSTGLSLDESTKLINSLADSAAYGRQSFYTMGGAIQASLDGIKNGNSVLSDAVGVTKNLSTMQKEYAASIGTTVGKLTDAQKIQAAYNGFINEGIYYVGNADQAMQGIIGSQARFTQATNQATVAMGDAFTPVVQKALETLTPLIIELADFTSTNKELVSGLATGTAGVLAFIVVLTSAATALKVIPALFTAIKVAAAGLGIATGPLGIALLAVGALASAFGALTAAKAKDKAATEEMLAAQKELNELLEKAPIDRSSADDETLRSKADELNVALEKRAELQERINEIQAAGERGEGTPAMLSESMDINDELEKMDTNLRSMGYDGVEQATEKLGELNQALKYSVDRVTEQDKAEYEALATKKATLVQMSALATEFKTLNAAQTLDAAQKNRMVDITEKLIDQYPELNAQQGEDGRIRATNIDTIIDQIATDKRFTDMAADNAATRIRNFAKENKAQAESVQAQIDNYTRLIQAMAQVSGARAETFADSVKQGEAKMSGGTPGVMDIVFNKALTNKVTQEAEQKRAEALQQQQKYAEAARNMEKLADQVTTGTQTFDKAIIAPDPEKGPKAKKEKKEKSAAELAAEARKAAYDADLKTVQFQADFYNMTADQQIKKYEELRKKHAQFLKESVDDARTLSLQLKSLAEDSVKSRYDFSATWIDAESKRMEDSGKTELQIAEMKLASWTRLRNRYAKDSEQYKAADEQRRQSRKEVASATEAEARDKYEASAKWIDAEERRMSDAGKSETDITQMKLAAWTRVRDRYSKDSEYYAKADEQLYQARKEITKQTVALADDLVKAQKSAIDEAKKADLDAIDKRKKAAMDDYDARIEAIQKLRDANKELNVDADYATQLAEKRARLAELQSAVGQPGIDERNALLKEIERMQLEHDRDLADRTLETQQEALSDEKDAKGKAYDDEKSAAEAQYDALLKAFDAYSGDIKTVEDGIAAYRVSSASGANTAILTELDSFIAQYNAKMAAVTAANAQAKKDADLAEYNANKSAWTAAKKAGNTAEMARLNARNEELRKLYGIPSDTGVLQHFSAGGVVQGAAGSAVPIVAHAGEIVLNPQQQAALWDMVANPRVAAKAPATITQITQHIDLGVDEVTLTDRADIATFYDERTRALQRLQAMGVKE